MMMNKYQKAMVDERNDLDGKLIKLYSFILSNAFHDANDVVQDVLNRKHNEWVEEFDVLNKHIGGFKIETEKK